LTLGVMVDQIFLFSWLVALFENSCLEDCFRCNIIDILFRKKTVGRHMDPAWICTWFSVV